MQLKTCLASYCLKKKKESVQKMKGLVLLCILLQLFFSAQGQPAGMHISLSGPSSVKCSWSSADPLGNTTTAVCRYGTSSGNLSVTAEGESYTYTAGGFTGSLYDVTLSDLPADKKVFYQCSSNSKQWTEVFSFTYKGPHARCACGKEGGEGVARVGFVADMGIINSQDTIACLKSTTHAQYNRLALIVHAGDISYADNRKPHDNNSYVWTEFLNSVEQAAAFVPYMTSPGNHEAQFNFSAYIHHFHTPYYSSNSTSPFWYSFDYLGVHFTMISTEHDITNGSLQQQWILQDLAQAHERRHLVPWLVVVGHRPLYCSSIAETNRCTQEAPVYRSSLEWIFHLFNVDVYICGHNHQYERSYPVLYGETQSHNYTDATATVYIVNGAAGNEHPIDPTFLPEELVPWRAAHGHLLETSWLVMEPSRSNLCFELRTSEDNQTQDRFTLEKSS